MTGKVADQTARLAPAADLLERLVTSERVRGAALAVAVGGNLVAEIYRGAASGEPVSASTLWPVASTTKLYTAATIFALVERGVLTLSMPAQCVLPEFTGEGRERITVR